MSSLNAAAAAAPLSFSLFDLWGRLIGQLATRSNNNKVVVVEKILTILLESPDVLECLYGQVDGQLGGRVQEAL
jgi:hypothetical protein